MCVCPADLLFLVMRCLPRKEQSLSAKRPSGIMWTSQDGRAARTQKMKTVAGWMDVAHRKGADDGCSLVCRCRRPLCGGRLPQKEEDRLHRSCWCG